MADDKYIDPNKMTQRELLILMHNDVKTLKADVKEIKEEHHTTTLKVNTLETRSKVWGGVVGFFTAVGTILFERAVK